MARIPFDKLDGKIWLDGKSIDWQDAKIHLLTHGLHYGSSVFEGIRVYNGKPFKLTEHMNRLKYSGKVLGLNINFSVAELEQATISQIKENNIVNGYVRPVAWRGCEEMLVGGTNCITHVAIAAWKSFEAKRTQLRETGISLNISSWRKPDKSASPYDTKAASIYTLATLVKNEASSHGYDDAIMLDHDGNITECSTSNIFFIKDNQLYTPIPDCFLNGITRQTIIAIADNLNIKCVEKKIKPEELENFDAGFLTGTAIEIMPIRNVEKKSFETNHELIKLIASEYSKLT